MQKQKACCNFYMSVFTKIFSKKIKSKFKKFRKFNAINNLDKKMLNWINYENGYYLECGANDGVDQSNTWYFEKQLNWNGILIEPLPKLFNQLKKNRNKNNIFVNKCLVSQTYKDKYIKIIDKDLMSKIDLKNGISVEVSTLDKILSFNQVPKIIDFFSLDVEGEEFNVLEGINFLKYNFKYLLIESNDFNKLNKFLITKNYSFVKKLSDIADPDWLFKFNS